MFEVRALEEEAAFVCVGDSPEYQGPRSLVGISSIRLQQGLRNALRLSRLQIAMCGDDE